VHVVAVRGALDDWLSTDDTAWLHEDYSKANSTQQSLFGVVR
jgi:hypothetical protein